MSDGSYRVQNTTITFTNTNEYKPLERESGRVKIEIVMQFPRLLVVRQKFPDRRIPDVAAEVRSQLAASGFAARLKPGSRVAIGVGSRGIHSIATIVSNVVRYWKDQGMQPFLFPAMGSHGAASAAGQAEVLANYGITEATMGCPLISQLEVVSLGKTSDGIEAFMDREAYSSDGVMLVGRGQPMVA